jgi:hypothetical protein
MESILEIPFLLLRAAAVVAKTDAATRTPSRTSAMEDILLIKYIVNYPAGSNRRAAWPIQTAGNNKAGTSSKLAIKNRN